NVGEAGSVQGITAQVNVANAGNWSTLNVDDSADATPRTVNLSVSGNFGNISGLAPAVIQYRKNDLRALNVWGGNDNNTFNIYDTVQSTIAGGSPTTLHAGAGFDVINVLGTTGPLVVDPQNNYNHVTFGGPAGLGGSLTKIRGDVTVRGQGTGNFLDISDSLNSAPYTYTMDAQRLY